MTNLDKLPSGSYRYRKMINGMKINLTFDHKPTSNEITLAVHKYLSDTGKQVDKNSFMNCCENYIIIKTPVLSPSTIRVYKSMLRAMSDDLLYLDINEITQIVIQNEIGQYSLSHSPKSTHNLHGFISAVLSMYRPDFQLHTTLPQKVKYDNYVPSEEEVKKVLETSENTPYHIAIQLGILGMRRSEICALTDEDLNDNMLSINKAKVKSDDGWVVKNVTKTTEGKRTIYLPDALVKEIKAKGMYHGAPDTLVHYLHSTQDKLGIPHFRFHDLRGFYASYAHSKGVPEQVILETGGWRSSFVMKNVYRRAMEKDKQAYQKSIAEKLLIKP